MILLLLIFLCRDGQLYVVILRNQQRSASPGPVGAEIVLYQLQRFVDLYLSALIDFESTHYNRGSRVGVVVRALAFHQCVPGSIPGPGVICGLSLLVLYSAPRGFSPGTPVFPSPQKPTFDLI